MDMLTITLLSYGIFDDDFLEDISTAVSREYFFPVNIESRNLDISDYYDPVRRQYDANKLLKRVDDDFPENAIKTLGLFRVDLYIPILTYIFGQAFLDGRSGVASLYRLKNERYGMVPDETLLLERFKKEVIHELGHTFGLKHCHTPTCVMRSSTYVEDIDQKKSALCPECKKGMRAF